MSAKHEADLKFQARLLPELYNTRSNYKLIVSITIFGIKNVFWEVLLNENISSAFHKIMSKTVSSIAKKAIKACVIGV